MIMSFVNKIQDRHVELFLKICIVYTVILHIVPYFYNRSLGYDEAMLVSSICTRSLSELVASPLDWGQSAPVGYLFVVKLITMVWNTSEAALRIFSLFSAFMSMFLFWSFLKNRVTPKFALWATAIFSISEMCVRYGFEAKPYMSDSMFCMLVLYIWLKYRENKIELYKLCLIYAVIVWFSFSAVFFMGACMCIECLHLIRTQKNAKKLLLNGVFCSIVLVSLLVNYMFWLSSTASNVDEAGFWALLKFPLIPKSISDVKLIIFMFFEFWSGYPKMIVLFLSGLVLFYLFVCVKNKNDRSKILVPYFISILFMLLASSLGFYPIMGRLLQAVPMVSLIIVAFACDEVCKLSFVKRKRLGFIFQLILMLFLVREGAVTCRYFCGPFVYRYGEEVVAGIDYLKSNLKENDCIYVNRYAIPQYSYKTGFQISFRDLKEHDSYHGFVEKIDYDKSADWLFGGLPYQLGNTIYGQSFVKLKLQIPYSYEKDKVVFAIRQDADLISKYNSVYLFVTHRSDGMLDVIDILRQYGTVETVVDSYKTRLYHFIKNKS